MNAMPITGSAAANVSLLDATLVPERKKIIGDIRNDTFDFLARNNYKFIPSQSNCFMIDTGQGRQAGDRRDEGQERVESAGRGPSGQRMCASPSAARTTWRSSRLRSSRLWMLRLLLRFMCRPTVGRNSRSRISRSLDLHLLQQQRPGKSSRPLLLQGAASAVWIGDYSSSVLKTSAIEISTGEPASFNIPVLNSVMVVGRTVVSGAHLRIEDPDGGYSHIKVVLHAPAHRLQAVARR